MVITSLVAKDHKEVILRKKRGTYQLNFNSTYVTYVNLDIELMISLPTGYTFSAAIPGSKDFIHASPIQNTMYITKTCEGYFNTNLSMHIITPEGIEEKLIFRLVSRSRAPKVLAIHFSRPNSSEMNRTIEKVKARYGEQLKKALFEQEKVLNQAIFEDAMSKGMAWFIQKRRGALRVDYKGAEVVFNGMFNSRGETYLYVKSKISRDECHLIDVKKAGTQKNVVETEFVCAYEDDNGEWIYVFKIPEISVKTKKNRVRKQKFHIIYKIWSEEFKQTFRIS